MWNALVVTPLAEALKFLAGWLQSIGVPYHFGFAIIIFTAIIKLITLPLNLKQLQSMKATQELQPKLQELQKKYGNDREKLAKAQMELYKEAGVSPFGGCLPMLIQFPILIGLYSALYSLADTVELGSFFWIPDLAFPGRGEGISWLFPFPPKVGWETAVAYLVLPVLTVITQLVFQKMSQPATGTQDSQQGMMNSMMMIMPIFFGYITLQVPAGLTLYWVVSNIFSIIQQYFVTGWGGLRPAAAPSGAKASGGSAKRDAKAPAATPAGATAAVGSDAEASVEETAPTRKKQDVRRRKRKKR
ncbi:MAG: YidC/Oxa1 family membrane protein insertase [Anaerolineae bacterium]|nr:YidC/Oxa1 family membrane protein insertase [Anaerolineae bacterium]